MLYQPLPHIIRDHVYPYWLQDYMLASIRQHLQEVIGLEWLMVSRLVHNMHNGLTLEQSIAAEPGLFWQLRYLELSRQLKALVPQTNGYVGGHDVWWEQAQYRQITKLVRSL